MREMGKAEFDAAVTDGRIADAMIETPDSKEPYTPNRRAKGMLDGETVWAWVRGPKVEQRESP